MKRTTLIGALAGVAVLLVGCSSNSGTAAPASTTSSSMASAAPSSATSSSAPMSSAPATSAPESSAPESSAPVSSAETASSSAVESSGGTGSLDATTTTWFTSFCGSVAPALQAASDLKAKTAAATTASAQQKLIVGFLNSVGGALSTSAKALKPLPTPTFKGGAEFATKTIAAFAALGPELERQAKTLAATDAAKDPSALKKALLSLPTQMTKVVAPIEGVGTLDIPDSTKAQLLQIPACSKLQAIVGG